MKKKVCMALSAMLAFGNMPVYGAEWAKYEKRETEYLFTAKVGTKEFLRNGEAQPLDVEIYIKDGYVMLPLRTFMKAVEKTAVMEWDDLTKTAQVYLGEEEFSFDINGNRIWREGELLPVFGEMEVKNGRVFVPLRNWGKILDRYGYVVKENDIQWDADTQTAAIRAVDVVLVDGIKPLALTGKGKEAEYSLHWTSEYDSIQSIGEGYFIARKYVNAIGDLYGNPNDPYHWQSEWFLLNAEGKVLMAYDSEEVNDLKDQGEGLLRVERWDQPAIVIDREGNIQFETECRNLHRFSEDLAAFIDFQPNAARENEDGGYIDKTGKIVIPQQFYGTNDFSEGLAAASVHYAAASRPQTLYGYIDTNGKWVIEPIYFKAGKFKNGIAKVMLNSKVGYIDKTGKEIIKLRYDWGSDFYEGKAFVKEKDGRVFLIDTTGKQLKQITDGQTVSDFGQGILKLNVSESPAPGIVKYAELYFDENGQISEREAKLKAGLSEGLAVMQDENTEKYGYVDTTGTWVIAPSFDRAEPFEDGYAVVVNERISENGETDVEWGIIKYPQC